jgi:hypothetical protein
MDKQELSNQIKETVGKLESLVNEAINQHLSITLGIDSPNQKSIKINPEIFKNEGIRVTFIVSMRESIEY